MVEVFIGIVFLILAGTLGLLALAGIDWATGSWSEPLAATIDRKQFQAAHSTTTWHNKHPHTTYHPDHWWFECDTEAGMASLDADQAEWHSRQLGDELTVQYLRGGLSGWPVDWRRSR